jgi:hypothetical protein
VVIHVARGSNDWSSTSEYVTSSTFSGGLLGLSHHSQEAETRAKQATGTDEEVNDHIKVCLLPATQPQI